MNEVILKPTHSVPIGYFCWFFGFTGLHRFYYGKPLTGILWLLTGGVFLVGWLVDVFLIPLMDEEARKVFRPGYLDYSAAWLLLIFTGVFGLHRFYLGKWATGILYLLTGGLFFIGVLYDFCTLNDQVSDSNSAPLGLAVPPPLEEFRSAANIT